MKSRISITLTIVVLALWSPRPFAQQNRGEVMLRAAVETETVKGDLRGAIEQYKKVIEAGDRTVAVKALLHMAECYQKLGDAEAQKVYERVVREYPDQKEAVVARARLDGSGSARRATATTLRTIWTGPKVDPNGAVSPDGRFLTFTDGDTGDLAIHDLTTGADRRLTNKGSWAQSSALAEDSVVSRDGKYVAYAWCDCRNRYSLRVVGVKEDGASEPRVLFENEGVAWIAPFDWSPDGKQIAVQLIRQDDRTTQIGWVAVQDGSLHILKSVDWRRSGKLVFSPDGKYLAFDLPVDDMTQRDVFLIAVDGSREIPVAASPARDVVVGWSSDGARLLFASDRSGAAGLWSVAVNDGRPSKAPELIKPGVGQIGERPLGVTANGSLYFAVPVGGSDVYVESLDFSTGKALVQASRTGQKLVGFNRQPDWSPDGRFLAYVSSRAQTGREITTLAIQSAESGALIRELHPQLTYAEFPHWTPDGRSLVAYGWDLKGGSGTYGIDAQTGATTKIAEGDLHGPQMSADGKKIYSTRLGENMAIVEVDVASGQERELIRRKDLSTPALSPDGRFLAARSNDPSTKLSVILLIDVDSGEARDLSRLSQPQSFQGNAVSWTPDGSSVIAKKTQSGRPFEVLLIPVSGGEPRKLEIATPSVTAAPIRVHPDGRRIALTAGQNQWEISALENFLPAPTASK